MTILLTTHNMDEAEDICDRLAFIDEGRIRFVGTPRAFRRSVTVQETVEVAMQDGAAIVEQLQQLPGVTHATTGNWSYCSALRLYCDDGFAVLKEVVALLDRSGVKAAVSMVEPSLEDAFSIFVKNGKEAASG